MQCATEINILLVAFLAIFFFFESVPDVTPPRAAAKSRSSSKKGPSVPKNKSMNTIIDLEVNYCLFANSGKHLLNYSLIKKEMEQYTFGGLSFSRSLLFFVRNCKPVGE